MSDYDRLRELACRLVAPGPKAAHVSASECHEISLGLSRALDQLSAVTKARDELADALQSLAQVTSQHGDYTQDPDYLLAARLRATGTTEGEGER